MDPFLFVAAGVAAVGCATDLKTGKIPNALTIPALVLAPLARFAYAEHLGMAHDEAVAEGAFAIAGAIVAAIAPLVLYRKNAIGAGDVKLLAALGALAQPSRGLEIASYAFVAALLFAPVGLLFRGKLVATIRNVLLLARDAIRPANERGAVDASTMTWIKMGPAIFVATAVTTVFHVLDGRGAS